MNFSSVTTAPSISGLECLPTENEGKIVAFIICAMRSGIPKEQLFAYLIQNKKGLDLLSRDKCFLRALEINESIEEKGGRNGEVVPVGLITEIVRLEFMPKVRAVLKDAVVRQLHVNVETSAELLLPRIGETVNVVEVSPDGVWVFVDSTRGSGWVPKACLETLPSEQLDI